jgi:hypothetical protein
MPQGPHGKVGFIARIIALASVVLHSTQNIAARNNPSEQAVKPFTAPIHVVVPVSPTPFGAGQRFHLVYELHNSNLGKSARTLTHIGAITEKPANRLLAKWADIFRNGRIFVTQDVAGLHISG